VLHGGLVLSFFRIGLLGSRVAPSGCRFGAPTIMTTTSLQLAIDIATAARRAKTDNLGAVAVLKTLDAQGVWFSRQREVEGITVDEPLPKPTRTPKAKP
jgi:hypothetical protein